MQSPLKKICLLICLLACAGYVIAMAWMVDTRLARVSKLGQYRDELGHVEGHQKSLLVDIALDGYTWLRLTREMVHKKQFRLSWTEIDNAPKGREVHWNSGFALWIASLAKVESMATGKPFDYALEHVGVWANPILLVFAILGFGWYIARRFGLISACLAAYAMATFQMFNEGLGAAYPDHHGIVNLAGFGMLVGLLSAGLGWQAKSGDILLPVNLKQMRIGIWISAVFGAAGLWISAISQVLFFIGSGLGLLAAAWFCASAMRSSGCTYHAGLWKQWGKIGAGLSLALWMFEYFPDRMGMRLEVNHPFYSLAWLGGGYALEAICGWLAARPKKMHPFPWEKIWLPSLALLPIPISMYFGGAACYALTDPFLFRLHHLIAEFLPLATRMAYGLNLWDMFGVYPFLGLMALILVFNKNTPPRVRTLLIFTLFPLFFLTLMQSYQTRWGLLAGVCWVMLLFVIVPGAASILPEGGIWKYLRVGLLLMLVASMSVMPFRIFLYFRALSHDQSFNFKQDEANFLLHRDVARLIQKNAGDRKVILLSSPNSSCLTGYFGNFQTLGTLYWENLEGLSNVAEIYSMQDDNQALNRIRQLGITHMVFITWENFMEPYIRLRNPDVTVDQIRQSFAIRLFFKKALPSWLRPIPYPMTELRKLLNYDVMILEVVPDQTLPEAQMYVGLYLINEGNPGAAAQYFTQALAGNANLYEARFNLGLLQIQSMKEKEGLVNVETAISQAPADKKGRFENQLAFTCLKIGRPLLASEAFKKSLAFEPGNSVYAMDYAWFLATTPEKTLHDTAAAWKLVEGMRAKPEVNSSPRFYDLLASLRLATGDSAGARQEALHAMEIAKANFDAKSFGISQQLLQNAGAPAGP